MMLTWQGPRLLWYRCVLHGTGAEVDIDMVSLAKHGGHVDMNSGVELRLTIIVVITGSGV